MHWTVSATTPQRRHEDRKHHLDGLHTTKGPSTPQQNVLKTMFFSLRFQILSHPYDNVLRSLGGNFGHTDSQELVKHCTGPRIKSSTGFVLAGLVFDGVKIWNSTLHVSITVFVTNVMSLLKCSLHLDWWKNDYVLKSLTVTRMPSWDG